MVSVPIEVLDDLAKRINAEHDAAALALRAGVEHARRAGDLLLEVKAGLPHGQWGRWVRKHCHFSERTVQAYMRVAAGWDVLKAKTQHVADLTLRAALVHLAEPTAAKERREIEAAMAALDEAIAFGGWAGGEVERLKTAFESAETFQDYVVVHAWAERIEQHGRAVLARGRDAAAIVEAELARMGRGGGQ